MQAIDHTQNIIELQHISYKYGKSDYAIKDISFNIHRGDYLGIIGPNGAGKTTVLKIMLGLLSPTHGNVKLFGQNIRTFKDWNKIGYVPQKATSFDTSFPVTVEEVVSMGTFAKRGLFRMETNEDRKKVQTALSQVGMLACKNKQIGDLSSGQQQRVFIARALAADPEIIFLDEPTVGVDIKAQEDFYLLLRKLNRTLKLTLVLISHELDVVAREATEVACINGSLTSYCTPDELMKEGSLKNLYGKELKYILHDHGSISST